MPKASPAPREPALEPLLQRFPPVFYERGETLIENAFLETADFVQVTDTGPPPMVGYVIEGLVRGAWNRSTIAPMNRATAVVAGDRKWIGADAFKLGKNLFRYAALTPTTASILPLAYLQKEAPREVLLDALGSVSRDWCTTASVLSLGGDVLFRRTLLLLYDMSRLHPRPEIEVRQKDIADMLGVARQTLQPVLKRLEGKGLITLGYGEIVIGDPIDLVRRLRGKK